MNVLLEKINFEKKMSQFIYTWDIAACKYLQVLL